MCARQLRIERAKTIVEENRSRGPDMTTYAGPKSWALTSPKNPKTAKTGFGTASRMPKDAIKDSPEPGEYQPKNCWDGRRVGMHGIMAKTLADFRSKSEPGLEPTAYDTSRGLNLVRPKEPKWNLKTTGGRSNLVNSFAPGPGTYDVNHKQVDERMPVITYARKTHTSLKYTHSADPHFGNFSMFG
mmetsp:Transcript_46188/g.148301  ORF Transcript_46188/g.148301 Transcript_46188/m.148301 type:complete len:186 (-) Transcript_46188:86-643(-)